MKKLLLWIPSVPFLLSFGFILLVFHVLQVIALAIGYKTHNRVVNAMVFLLNLNMCWLLSPIKFVNKAGKIPSNTPTIIICNHQSMFDIPATNQILRNKHPKYISKKSLAFGIPSVSYNIRNGGSIYIGRIHKTDEPAIKKAKKEAAIKKITTFNKYLKDNNRGGVIFPEGTRSKDGHMKKFKVAGLNQMLNDIPEATIIPVALDGFWRLTQYNLKPMGFRINLSCTVLPIIDRSNKTNEQIIGEAQQLINENVFDKV